MIVTTVTVFVKSEHIDDFIAASIRNHEGSVQEPGNLRFDVLQAVDAPNRFLLYEAYQSEAAAAAHKKTSHYLAWKEAVAGWMDRPREGIPHQVIRPTHLEAW